MNYYVTADDGDWKIKELGLFEIRAGDHLTGGDSSGRQKIKEGSQSKETTIIIINTFLCISAPLAAGLSSSSWPTTSSADVSCGQCSAADKLNSLPSHKAICKRPHN